MLQLAERDNLDVVEIKRESHSAKATGQRPVFNELLEDIRQGKFNALLAWAPDRLSRNAGDLGTLVDLMDQKLLIEIRTFGQKFINSPNEKFLLMILCSQAKLENDNRGLNVQRGLRTRCEMGLWPNMSPLGYLNQKQMDKKGQLIIDPERAPIVKQMFEKVAYEKWSGRKIYNWLKQDLNFYTRGNKNLTLSGVYRVLTSSFYYGMFEYPKNSGSWYTGKHEPLITKELFDEVQEQLNRFDIVRQTREFAFTKLFTCGLCGSGVSGEEKYKNLKDGSIAKYIYYSCTRSVNRNCKNTYIREEELINQLVRMIDDLEVHEIGMRARLENEVERFNNFQRLVLKEDDITKVPIKKIDIKTYAKYLLREGTIQEKRELLALLRTKLIYTNRKIYLKR